MCLSSRTLDGRSEGCKAAVNASSGVSISFPQGPYSFFSSDLNASNARTLVGGIFLGLFNTWACFDTYPVTRDVHLIVDRCVGLHLVGGLASVHRRSVLQHFCSPLFRGDSVIVQKDFLQLKKEADFEENLFMNGIVSDE